MMTTNLAKRIFRLLLVAKLVLAVACFCPKLKVRSLSKHGMLPIDSASLIAGSVAGAVGVGVSYPLDVLKVKAQLEAAKLSNEQPAKTANMVETASEIMQKEGVPGFFTGVGGVMAGESIVKAVAFTANAMALTKLQAELPSEYHTPAIFVAACSAGLISSFFIAPLERVKVLMQANPAAYKNELDCIRQVIDKEGWQGLFQRGLGTTILREIPGYGIYFGTYGVLTGSFDLGPLSSVVFGATAGSASWIPVYPLDIVLQNSRHHHGPAHSGWELLRTLYDKGGINALFYGITPTLMRSSVNHATTFTVYETIMKSQDLWN